MSQQFSNDHRQRLQVLSAGIFSLILVLGVARFAYTPMLPLMQQQAGLGVAAGGWLAAFNYAGYLSGAIAASLISDLVLKDRLYRIGLVLAVASTAMMGITDNVVLWAASRFIAGLSSAAGLLLGTGLIMNWLIRHNHRSELGIHFSGIGLGIAGCAQVVAIMSWWLDWQQQWWVLTVFGGLLLIPAWRWLPPPHGGAMPAGEQKWEDRPPAPAFMRLFMAAYFCAGVGYVVSTTFIVAIVEHLPGLTGRGPLVFLLIGIAGAPACIIWDLIARRTGDLNALMLASGLQVFGILLPLLGVATDAGANLSLAFAVLGSLLFGSCMVGIVSLVLSMAGRYYPSRPAKMMGRMTLSYGVAQMIAPAFTGWLATSSGTYASGLYFAAGAMVVCLLLLAVLRGMEVRSA